MKYAEDREFYTERVEKAHKLADQLVLHSKPQPEDAVDTEKLRESEEARLEEQQSLDHLLKSIFSQCDSEHDEHLSTVEIAPLVELLFDKRPDMAANYSYSVAKAVEDVMVHFDDDRSETIEFTEFVHLMACQPWISLIPDSMHEELKQKCEKLGFAQEEA